MENYDWSVTTLTPNVNITVNKAETLTVSDQPAVNVKAGNAPGQWSFIFPSWHLLMYSILYSGRHIATSKNPTRYPNKRLTHKPTITKIPPIRFRRENTCERTISINMPVNTCPTNKNSDR